jgi:toxin ParE1/3/4
MSRYRLTGPARTDLREIWNYVASHSERQADRLLDELTARFQDLADQPLLMGSTDIVYGTRYRISQVRDYVVFYEPDADGVVIARVIHGARDIESMSPF